MAASSWKYVTILSYRLWPIRKRCRTSCTAPPKQRRRSDDRAAIGVDFTSNSDTGNLGFTPGHVYTPFVRPPEDPVGSLSASYCLLWAKSYSDHKQIR